MQFYKCLVDGYTQVKKDGIIKLNQKKAYDEEGNELSIEIDYLVGSEDFVLCNDSGQPIDLPKASSGTPMPKVKPPKPEPKSEPEPEKYALVRKLKRTYSTIEEAAKHCRRKSADLDIVKIVGKVKITHNVSCKLFEGDKT